jgi:DNA-binding NtrC family response regulator
METILIAEDEKTARLSLRRAIENGGYRVVEASNRSEAIELFRKGIPGAVVLGVKMPLMDTVETIKGMKTIEPNVPVIIITENGDISTAEECMKQGAYDFLEKPVKPPKLVVAVRRALEFERLKRENITNRKFREHVVSRHSFQSIVTHSEAMGLALRAAEKVAAFPRTTVAIFGESGVGKEVLARTIHFASGGLPSNFVAVNCASIPDTLLESELFGHVKGAFTGADRDRDGKFALAKGGSLLLDEIGDMPIPLQAKLLRVIEERIYWKIGSDAQIPADFRIIAATHRDLRDLVRQGRFREDLFHRLNVFPIRIPPLRERKEDIPLLVDHFLPLFRLHQGKPFPGVSSKGMKVLMEYSWPGNIRELRNCLERAAILVSDELIRPEHLVVSKEDKAPLPDKIELRFVFDRAEFSLDAVVNKVLAEALKRCGGNKSSAAQLLRINRKMFTRKKLPDGGK